MTILFCFAHPDDESFAAAGLACACRAAGDRVVLVTATRGESGSAGTPPLCSREELPARRERELRKAADLLGIAEVIVLDYHDRTLADVDPAEMRSRLVRLIRRHRPAIVLTFDPNGFNRHVDHVAISRFTSDAIAAAADQRWLPDAGPAHEVGRLLWTPPMSPADAIRASNLHTLPGVDFVVDLSAWKEVKAAALRAHETQHVSVDRHFFSQPDVDQILSVEMFRQTWGPPVESRPGRDVRAGLV
ncbi:MAG TPA: PIG-L deacetylase family protein [Vicinamibacterales bacterium]|nr:PIG-L deacetylase family protein [Vicinamibacterales bacterium]